jgi:hypothetical protein
MKLYLFYITFLFGVIFLACKKYPENNLWLKKPEKVFKGGELTSYTVDGVDSFPMWDAIYNTPPDYNGMGYAFDVRSTYFGYDYSDHKDNRIGSKLGYGTLDFINKKKEIAIWFVMTSPSGVAEAKYNVFLTENSTWKILKLTKSGTLKIQRTYNNKIYEIQIN